MKKVEYRPVDERPQEGWSAKTALPDTPDELGAYHAIAHAPLKAERIGACPYARRGHRTSPEEICGMLAADGLLRGHAVFEKDSSLACHESLEIITLPHTITEWRAIDWEGVGQLLKERGYCSEQGGHCGLHVHLSRTLFGRDIDEQEESARKLLAFLMAWAKDWLNASRRSLQGLRYCALPCGQTANSNLPGWDSPIYRNPLAVRGLVAALWPSGTWCNSHSVALNVGTPSTPTFEMRLGRGTLNAGRIRSWCELVYHVGSRAKRISWGDVCDPDAWLEHAPKLVEDYCHERGVFGRTRWED